LNEPGLGARKHDIPAREATPIVVSLRVPAIGVFIFRGTIMTATLKQDTLKGERIAVDRNDITGESDRFIRFKYRQVWFLGKIERRFKDWIDSEIICRDPDGLIFSDIVTGANYD
jgi:hypothetical protein